MYDRQYPDEQLLKEHKRSSHNKFRIMKAKVCGCYYCKSTYPPEDITDWTIDDTAICPLCWIDSVLDFEDFGPNDSVLLDDMYDMYFNDEYDMSVEDLQDMELGEIDQ